MTSLAKELWKGKTLGRALLNKALAKELSQLQGSVVDIGGGSGSYQRFVPSHVRLIRTDYTGEGLNAHVDINNSLPFPDNTFDAVLLMNVLYIARDPEASLAEVRRILKPTGTLYMSTPYLMAEMREPHDYSRFTSEWIETKLDAVGFTSISILPIGERFSSAANLIDGFGTRMGRLLLSPVALLFDRLIPRTIVREHPAPICYLTRAKRV